jgi:hypothetical protein
LDSDTGLGAGSGITGMEDLDEGDMKELIKSSLVFDSITIY